MSPSQKNGAQTTSRALRRADGGSRPARVQPRRPEGPKSSIIALKASYYSIRFGSHAHVISPLTTKRGCAGVDRRRVFFRISLCLSIYLSISLSLFIYIYIYIYLFFVAQTTRGSFSPAVPLLLCFTMHPVLRDPAACTHDKRRACTFGTSDSAGWCCKRCLHGHFLLCQARFG